MEDIIIPLIMQTLFEVYEEPKHTPTSAFGFPITRVSRSKHFYNMG